MNLKNKSGHGVFALADEKDSVLASCTDAQLAELVKNGDSEAFAELTVRYMAVIRAKAQPYRSGGTEKEDLFQEGLLGLLNAARTFDLLKGASFRTYAGVCISNRIIMAYRSSGGRKNDPLSNFVSLNEDEAAELTMRGDTADPETFYADREGFKLMCLQIEKILTPLELRVLHQYLSGCSYSEIAKKLSVTEKAADNALQRARYKLKHMKNS